MTFITEDSFIDNRMDGKNATRPWLLELRSSKAFVTTMVSYAVFADQFVFAVIIPVMPFTLHDRAGLSEASVQYWVAILLAVYGAATAAVSPIWGWYADRYSSRRLPFLSGLVIIAVATIMIWLSRTMALQLLGRVLQGLAAAIVWVTGLALIADRVEEAEIGEYVGYLGIAMMVGTLIGPLLGGVVLAQTGYNAVFGMTLGIIGLDIVLRVLMIEKSIAMTWPENTEDEPYEEKQQNDLEHNTRGQVFEEKELEIQVQELDAGDERRTRLPAVMRLLSSRRLCVALWASFAIGAILAGLETVLPIHTEETFGWDSEGAGLIFLPLTLPSFLGPLVGWICDRFGPRWPMAVGFLFLCPILTLLRYVSYNSLDQKVLFCALLTLAACCFTLTMDPVMAEIAYVVAAKAKKNPEAYNAAGNKVYAQAFGLFNTAYSLGNTLGPIIAGLIKDAAGWSTMGWVLGLLGGLTAVPVLLWSGKPKR